MAYKLVVILICVGISFAYNAWYGGELYQDGKNARNAALGGLSVSYADGCNPVLLKNKKNSSIHFSQKNKFGGLAQITILSYIHTGKKYPLYFGLTNRSVDKIPDTRSAWIDNGNSIPESGEINYFNIHEIVQQEIGIQISTIRFWGPYTLGFTLKPSFSSLSEFKSYGISGDLAAILKVPGFDMTLRLEDILWHKYWNSTTLETIAPLIMGGIHYRLSKLLVGLETGSRIESNTIQRYHVGIEYKQQEQFFLRVGTSHSNLFTAGIGIHLSYTLVLLALAFVENVSYIVAFHRLSIPLGAALGILILKEKFYPLKLLGVLIMLVGLLGVALG